MARHHLVQEGAVRRVERGVFLCQDAVPQEHAKLAFEGHVVAGHGAHQVRESRLEVVLPGPELGQFKLHQPPIGAARGQGFQFFPAGVEVVGGHQVPRPLQLKHVAFGKVLAGPFQKLTEVLEVGGLFHQTQRFGAHVFVGADVFFIPAEEVQRGQHVPVAQEQVGAFQQHLQVPWTRRHEGLPVPFRTDSVALSQPCRTPVVQHPRVVGVEVSGPV